MRELELNFNRLITIYIEFMFKNIFSSCNFILGRNCEVLLGVFTKHSFKYRAE